VKAERSMQNRCWRLWGQARRRDWRRSICKQELCESRAQNVSPMQRRRDDRKMMLLPVGGPRFGRRPFHVLYQCGDPLPRGKLKRLTADTKLWTRTDRPLPMSTATPIRAIPELAVSPGESVLEICEKNYLQAKRVLSKRSGQFGDTRSLT
jgi:hypothetical protein